jgi:2-dehydro-3-deoxy-D-arabinonate dehydratase
MRVGDEHARTIRRMKLTKLSTPSGARWLCDETPLTPAFSLSALLAVGQRHIKSYVEMHRSDETFAFGTPLPPTDPNHEVWASGVTYLRSRDARKAESAVADVYQKVYEAERPELFMKASGWRVLTSGESVRIRADAKWNVPEPELVLVIDAHGTIVGYTAGNDMSSRDIEGENPLYLPQAKIYNGSCALSNDIVFCDPAAMRELPVNVSILRGGESVFSGETSISRMKRTLEDLAGYLYRELAFPNGAFLMTGTGIVPPESFTLQRGDMVHIAVGEVSVANAIA